MQNNLKASDELHKNHRLRMKERILSQGISSLQEHEVLEYLLYYAVQRRDTNPLAHRIIQHCGSLSDVFHASYEDLLSVPGVTPHIALFLNTLPDIFAYCNAKEQQEQKPCLEEKDAREAFVLSQLGRNDREHACLVALDAHKRVIAVKTSMTGSFSELAINIRDVLTFCLQKKAAYLLLAHNHPSGVASPSQEDIDTTRTLIRTLSGIEVQVLDHLVVANGRVYSFVENMIV